MAKAIAVSNERSEPKGPQQPSQLVGTWERWMGFLKDVRNEMRKVTAPTFKEVRATTTVVVITVAIFAIYFWIIDFVIQNGVTQLFKAFRAHY